MGFSREIQGKIKSIQSTQKITSAMEMVAASKMRKAQDRMDASSPYASNLKRVICHLTRANLTYEHPFLIPRKVETVGLVIVSTNRGLCGGLNTNLFRYAIHKIKTLQKSAKKVKLFLFGRKAQQFFNKINLDILAVTTDFSDQPMLEDLTGTIEIALNSYLSDEIQELHLIYNQFVSRISQKPDLFQLLPTIISDESLSAAACEYIYEPSAKQVLDVLLKQYVEHLIYHGVVENIACEQSSRMLAMQNATDNAGEIINLLGLKYNKARQAAITQEITEIVSGADAI